MAAPQGILNEHWILRNYENSSAGDSPIFVWWLSQETILD